MHTSSRCKGDKHFEAKSVPSEYYISFYIFGKSNDYFVLTAWCNAKLRGAAAFCRVPLGRLVKFLSYKRLSCDQF